VPAASADELQKIMEPRISGVAVVDDRGTAGGIVSESHLVNYFELGPSVSVSDVGPLQNKLRHKATSLVVVATSLPFRTATISFAGAHWPIIVNLLAGSLIGAWVGADWATRLRSESLYRVIAVLLVVPEIDRLFLAVRASGGESAAVWVSAARPGDHASAALAGISAPPQVK
jgi:hypothetical protein